MNLIQWSNENVKSVDRRISTVAAKVGLNLEQTWSLTFSKNFEMIWINFKL